MKNNYQKIFKLIILFLFFLVNNSYSQEYNYARLTVIYGADIPFNFRSINNYKNGITITNGTVLGITLADSNQAGVSLEGFDLRFRSFNSQANIEGSVYDIPLSTIELEASNNIGLGAATYTGLKELSTSWTNLVEYTQNPINPPAFSDLIWSNHQVNISYSCGVTNTLLGEESDYYSVEIEIELIPTGPGF